MPPELPPCPYHESPPPPELEHHLLCAWRINPVRGGDQTALPDGTISIFWGQEEAPILAGPDTGPVPSTRPSGTSVEGVSFRPGAAPMLLGVPAVELRDQRVPLAQIWGADAERMRRRLDGNGTPGTRLKLIEGELRRRLTDAGPPDGLVAAAVARLRGRGPREVRTISAELGISERQLRRRFHATVGYGPKTLTRILRFQRMLALARRRDVRSLGQLAIDSGYADQAHMTAECTRLARASPARLLAVRYLLQTRTE